MVIQRPTFRSYIVDAIWASIGIFLAGFFLMALAMVIGFSTFFWMITWI